MEPNEFDHIFKQKVGEKHTLYQEEIASSKSRVWEAIQNDLPAERKRTNWYYWAAAILILMISLGGFLFNQMEKNHQQEMNMLRAELESYQLDENENIDQLNETEKELDQLRHEVNSLLQQLEDQEGEGTSDYLVREIVHRDTVYIERIEYQELAPTTQDLEVGEEMAVETGVKKEETEKENEGKDNVALIYPSQSKQNKIQKNQAPLTLKVGPFSSQ